MIRDYSDGVTNDVKMFVGTEVEHTPALGMRTLFVVGILDPAKIHAYALAHDCDHIYFGANQSFPKISLSDSTQWRVWEDMIVTMLKSGRGHTHSYMCTLDIDISCVEGLIEGPLTEFNNFIPMLSVKLPYIQQLGYNATIKLDDKDFKATNPGVWCHSLHNLKDRTVFTDWSKYTQDEIIK
jgi:hypothetical protein